MKGIVEAKNLQDRGQLSRVERPDTDATES